MTTPINIWFNRSYETFYWIVEDIHNRTLDGYAFTIYITHADATSPILQKGDHVALEPADATDEEYVAWALEYCAANRINIMVPVARQDVLTKAQKQFNELGVTLIAAPAETVNLFEDKNIAYETAKSRGIPVPPWYVASSTQGVRDAYKKLHKELGEESRIVVKPVKGVGGKGFFILQTEPETIQDLIEREPIHLTLPNLLASVKTTEEQGLEVPPLMLLPYLTEPELSVDCLASPTGELLRIAPRVKVGPRLTHFTLNYPAVIEATQKLAQAFKIPYTFNVQWRWFNGEPVLLEVNTRASGGLFALLNYTGENYVWNAIRLSLGETIEPDLNSLREGAYIPITSSVAAKMLPLESLHTHTS